MKAKTKSNKARSTLGSDNLDGRMLAMQSCHECVVVQVVGNQQSIWDFAVFDLAVGQAG